MIRVQQQRSLRLMKEERRTEKDLREEKIVVASCFLFCMLLSMSFLFIF